MGCLTEQCEQGATQSLLRRNPKSTAGQHPSPVYACSTRTTRAQRPGRLVIGCRLVIGWIRVRQLQARSRPHYVRASPEATCSPSEQQDSEQRKNMMKCFWTSRQKPSRCFSMLSALSEQISRRPCSWSRHTRRDTQCSQCCDILQGCSPL